MATINRISWRTLITLTSSILLCTVQIIHAQTGEDVAQVLTSCQKDRSDFNDCLKQAFNDFRPFFKTGIPELNIAPFDPHRSSYVELRRGDTKGLGGFRLLLSDVSEYGWVNSVVTKVKTDQKNSRIVYSQYFPEKSLDGLYSFKGQILGKPLNTHGVWNLTLYKYSQTTSVTRIGGPGGILKVRVEIDQIGDLSLHITDFLGGKKILEKIGDFFINSMWQLGFPFIKPIINELVSTAFTDIFNESFRYLNIDKFIS